MTVTSTFDVFSSLDGFGRAVPDEAHPVATSISSDNRSGSPDCVLKIKEESHD
jgi:hypothetical protein